MKRIVLCLLMGVSSALTAPSAGPGTRNSYTLHWYAIDGGGASSSGGNFALVGTIGQPDVGRASAGDFVLYGGFWGGGDLMPSVAAPSLIPGPTGFRLFQSTPNPFRSSTAIAFTLPEASWATVSVVNVQGQLVRTVLNRSCPVGRQIANWDGSDEQGAPVGSGLYFVKVRAGGLQAYQRVLLLR